MTECSLFDPQFEVNQRARIDTRVSKLLGQVNGHTCVKARVLSRQSITTHCKPTSRSMTCNICRSPARTNFASANRIIRPWATMWHATNRRSCDCTARLELPGVALNLGATKRDAQTIARVGARAFFAAGLRSDRPRRSLSELLHVDRRPHGPFIVGDGRRHGGSVWRRPHPTPARDNPRNSKSTSSPARRRIQP